MCIRDSSEHRAPPARVRERTDEQVRGRAPAPRGWRVWKFEPVELGLGPCRVGDDRVVPPGRVLARLAVRPQRPGPQAAGEARIRTLVAERDDLVEQGGRPQMRIVAQTALA